MNDLVEDVCARRVMLAELLITNADTAGVVARSALRSVWAGLLPGNFREKAQRRKAEYRRVVGVVDDGSSQKEHARRRDNQSGYQAFVHRTRIPRRQATSFVDRRSPLIGDAFQRPEGLRERGDRKA